MKFLYPTLTSSLFLKVTSLILGFLVWTTLSELVTQSIWLTIPVCFYNNDGKQIKAPESLRVELKGKRSHIKLINKETLVAHIDAHQLHSGTNRLTITHNHLLLPPSILLATRIPHIILVHVDSGEHS